MKPRIFISAVTKELRSARQIVANTLMALGYEPVWQDIFVMGGEDIRPMLRKKIDSCAALLQIVGNAYGGEPPIPDEAFGRVSYTQYEAIYARSTGKKVYYLLAQPDLLRDAEQAVIDAPRDDSDAAKADAVQRRDLQEAYFASIQSTEHIYYAVHNHPETELTVRRLKDDLDRLRRGFRSWMIGVTAALFLIIGGVAWLMRGQPEIAKSIIEAEKNTAKQIEDAGEKTKKEIEKSTKELTNPSALAERIRLEIYATAEKKIKALSGEQGQGRKIAQIERERDLAAGRIDDLIRLIQEGLDEGASPVFQRAADLLQIEGTEEALTYLESRREAELDSARRHANQVKSAQARAEAERELRNRSLKAIVLEAELLESKLKWEDALNRREQVAELAPDWINARNRLGVLQYQLARFQDAEPNMREAVKLASSPEQEAGMLNDLSNLLMDTNRLLPAELLLRRALAIDERAYGTQNANVAIRLNNLMVVLRNKGRWADAEPLSRRSLAINEQTFGGGHSRVAIDLNNLALLLQATNNKSVAEFLQLRALAIDEKRFGPEHPDVARDLGNLATLYQETNRLAEAEPLMRRSLAIFERAYGAEHPHVGIVLNNLGFLYRDMTRPADAEPLLRRSLAIRERSYGAEHTELVGPLEGLATVLQATKRLGEAEPLLRRRVVLMRLFEVKSGLSHNRLQSATEDYRSLLGLLKHSPEEIDQLVKSAMETTGPLQPITPEAERLLGPARPVAEVLAEVDRQYQAQGMPAIYFLKPDEPIVPHLGKPLIYNPDYLKNAGERSLRNGASDDAVVLYEAVIRLQEELPDHAQLIFSSRLNRAAALRELGEVEPARDELRLLLTEIEKDAATPAKTKSLTHYHLALCEWRLGDNAAAAREAEKSLHVLGGEGDPAAARMQSEQLVADLKAGKSPPSPPTFDPKAKLESARKRLSARYSLFSLPLTESASSLIDQILGPAKSTQEVFDALDRQYREAGKSKVWFLPLDKPIAPYLDELLGPLPSVNVREKK
ncbi:MAG: tetratricopeptide repeat protein [Pirellulaceae bacterium]